MQFDNLSVPKPKPKTTPKSTSLGDTAADFLFGKSDWEQAAAKAASGDIAGALGSAAWGGLALGSTAISFIPGLGTAAGAGIKGAAAAAKTARAAKTVSGVTKTLEAGKTTVTGVRGGKVLETAVQGGKEIPKPTAFSPGYPFKPTPTKPLTPTTPTRPVNVRPKDAPDALPEGPVMSPKTDASPWSRRARSIAPSAGLSAATAAATSAAYEYAYQPKTQASPSTGNPPGTGTITGTQDPRNRRDLDSNSFSSGMQFANIPKVN